MTDVPNGNDRQRADALTLQDGAIERRLDERLDAMLARMPEIQLSDDFAARVVGEVRAIGETIWTPARYGRMALLIGGGLLAVLMLVLMAAGHGQGPRWLLSLLSLELAIVALGAGPWRRVLRWPA